MDKIIVFSKYATRAPGFGVSMHEIIKRSLAELNIETEFISDYDNLYTIKNSTILFLIKPNIYISLVDKIDSSNKNIIWNLEPFSFSHVGDKKLDTFRYLYGKMTSNPSQYGLKHILFFDKRQSDLFNNNNCSYLPIGYHSCISSNKNDYNSKDKNSILFLGKTERERKNIFTKMVRIAKKKNMVFNKIDHSSFVSLEKNIDYIYGFRFGINCHDRRFRLHIHWHRIMMYAANNVALISQDDLSEFGFINRKHYIYYNKIEGLENIDFDDYLVFQNMTSEMKNKVEREYRMTQLFNNIMGILL